MNPTGVAISDWALTNAQTAFLWLSIDYNYTCKILTKTGTPIVGALVNLTDNQYLAGTLALPMNNNFSINGNKNIVVENDTNGKPLSSDITGTTTLCRVSAAVRTIAASYPDATVTMNPYVARYFAYGYTPLELKKDFITLGNVNESILLEVDSHIIRSTTYASAFTSGVIITYASVMDTNNNQYSIQIDCGNNSLSDVYHNLYYRMATYDSGDVNINRLRGHLAAPITTSDGNTFYGGKGIYFTNFVGTMAYMTADNGNTWTPLQYSFYTLSGLTQGTKIRIYDNVSGSLLGAIDSTFASSWTYQYAYSGTNTNIKVVVYNVYNTPITFYDTLDGSTTTVPITQAIDRVYYDPPIPELQPYLLNVSKNGNSTLSMNNLNFGMLLSGVAYPSGSQVGMNGLTAYSASTYPSATHGAVVDNGNNTITYTPTSNYLGADSFYVMPHYGDTFAGTVAPVNIPVLVQPFVGAMHNYHIVLGDSIFVRVFSATASPNFKRWYSEMFGRDITVYNEAVSGLLCYDLSGLNTSNQNNTIDKILAKYAMLPPAQTMVTLSIGTNDYAAVHAAGPSTWGTRWGNFYAGVARIKSLVQAAELS